MHFADDLMVRTREIGHPLCAGIDPHLARIPPLFQRGSMAPTDPATPAAVEALALAFLDRLVGRVAVVKPQVAFFEQMGSAGLAVLERVMAAARERELLVLLDAKRGDIGSTAEGYARAYLEPGAAGEVDAITLNPYMGLDTLAPFAERAAAYGRGLFVLAKTSNPGSGDLQDRLLEKAGPVYEAVASSLTELADELTGPATGWSSLGIVAGATYPEQAERLRALLPNALFLIPGYGAQGASAAEAVRSFVAGPRGLEGGLVNSSRGLLFPEAAASAESAGAWEGAVDAAIDRASEELGLAVGR
ncbi:MAG: orotidine-5'-phosphate decarboxylase [Myxococcota bacterium]|nr:orotidine-5'-phosphate decarboxylase [Myxococcota bacterium]